GAPRSLSRSETEEQTTEYRKEAGEKEHSPVRLYVELYREIERCPPPAEQPEKKNGQSKRGQPSAEGEEHGFGHQLARDPASPCAQRHADGEFLVPVGRTRRQQAGEIYAGGKKNKAGKQKNSRSERCHRSADHVPHQSRLRQLEPQTLVPTRMFLG